MRPVIIIPKNDVKVEVQPVEMISFTINDRRWIDGEFVDKYTTFVAEAGMTWEEWCDSEYNVPFIINWGDNTETTLKVDDNNDVVTTACNTVYIAADPSDYNYSSSSFVKANDVIIENKVYDVVDDT